MRDIFKSKWLILWISMLLTGFFIGYDYSMVMTKAMNEKAVAAAEKSSSLPERKNRKAFEVWIDRILGDKRP